MILRVATIVVKELLQFRRDRLLMLFILLVPVLQLVLMAQAVTRSIDEQGVVVMDLDHSRWSRQLAVSLDNTAELAVRYYAATNDEMRRLRKAYPNIPLYAVVTDICASGGYYIAVAADKIYVDKASLIGSIGVRMDSFGFVDALQKLGVERRLLTAGEHKGFLDPFLPSNPEDVAHVQGLLDGIHQQFIATVKEGRGDRLKQDVSIFSGLVWTGEQGIELGLVDALGSASYVAREVIGEEEIVDFTPQPDFFERFARGVGTTLGDKLIGTLNGTALK